MITWHAVGDPRGYVTDIVYVIDFRSADDDVTRCGQWSVNGSVNVTLQLPTDDDRLSTLVTGLCPATEFTFTVSRGDWNAVLSCSMRRIRRTFRSSVTGPQVTRQTM